MNTTRKAMAGAALVLALAATAAGCAHRTPVSPSTDTSAAVATTAPPPAPTGTPTPPPAATPTAAPTPPATGTGPQVRARVAYPWHWPNDPAQPGRVNHPASAPPVPRLVSIDAANHPGDLGQPPFNRMSFTFTTNVPSYTFSYTDQLIGDGSGQPIPLAGRTVLRIVFHGAQAHHTDGTSSISSQPRPQLGLDRMVQYAAAGDFEGVVTYGIGITWPGTTSNPHIAVRAYEVIRTDTTGQTRYVVAIDVDTSPTR